MQVQIDREITIHPMFSLMQVKTEIQHKMKIFGDETQTQMKQEDDHVMNDGTYQVLQILPLF